MAMTRMTYRYPGESMATRPLRPGLTLIEAVISVLIVAVMLTAVLSTLAGVARAAAVQYGDDSGQALARQLLAEVLQANYEDPDHGGGWGLEAGEDGATRADFDDTDDYDGWSASPPQRKDGTEIPDLAGYSRSVQVTNLNPVNLAASADSDLGLRRIDVTVSPPTGDETVVSALASKTGRTTSQNSTVTWTGLDLQIGQGDTIHDGVTMFNRPTAEQQP